MNAEVEAMIQIFLPQVHTGFTLTKENEVHNTSSWAVTWRSVTTNHICSSYSTEHMTASQGELKLIDTTAKYPLGPQIWDSDSVNVFIFIYWLLVLLEKGTCNKITFVLSRCYTFPKHGGMFIQFSAPSTLQFPIL